MKEQKYPVDSANLRWIRECGFVYVDKTEYIHKLVEKGKYFFLARPRRFGKSLFLDTLKEYFQGNRELFEGLAIDKLEPEEWGSYPVLRFNLSKKNYVGPSTLGSHLNELLNSLEKEFGLEESAKEYEEKFEYLIRNIKEKTGKRVVILIDEYDAPLTSSIGNPELQEIYRNQLHSFYSVLKGTEEYIHFCFLTGVTRYGKVSVFSGLNNLNDITFDNSYAGICGITTGELHRFYDRGVEVLADDMGTTKDDIYQKLKFYYDGYHFSERMLDIYNPFSINYVFDKKAFQDYWCQSGVPTILAKSLIENDYDIKELNGISVKTESLSDLSMQNLEPIPLFYQTGYLTLKEYDSRRKLYRLGYPNREVEDSILNKILKYYSGDKRTEDALIFDLQDALTDGEPQIFIDKLSAFLSGIPLKLREYVGKYENYYHTIFYCLATLIGLDIDAEYSTSEGFIDILVKTDKFIYIIELKVNGTADDALKQIEEKHYDAPFASDPRKLYKIGIGFSKSTGTITSSNIL